MKNISFPTVKLGIVVRHFFFNFIRVYSSSNNIQRKAKEGESKPTVDDLKKKCQKEQNLADSSFHPVCNEYYYCKKQILLFF